MQQDAWISGLSYIQFAVCIQKIFHAESSNHSHEFDPTSDGGKLPGWSREAECRDYIMLSQVTWSLS